MLNSLPPGTLVSRSDDGKVRRISHGREPVRFPDYVAASPVTLAARYLDAVEELLEPPRRLPPGDEPAEYLQAERRAELASPEVREGRDTIVVSYQQLYAGLPVFRAGLAVRMRRDLTAVLGAASTLHRDIKLDDMPAEPPEELTNAKLAGLLGRSRGKRPRIQVERLAIYRYDPGARLDPTTTEDSDQPQSAPDLYPPDVPKDIEPGRHYVVRDVVFTLELPDWGELEWRALIEARTGAVLYLRASVESCTGSVFRDDPITLSGNAANGPCAPAANLDPLATTVTLQGLTPPGIPGDPQPLSGEFVELVDTDLPTLAPPTAALPACDFTFGSTTDEFAAVNAYHHMDALYRMVEDMGFVNYFAGTTFPIPMDHRGENGGVNAHHHGAGNSTTKYRFGLAGGGCPVGIAADRRIVIHEFGHSVLRNRINSGTFSFAHGVGDSLAVILSDPASQVPDRFDTFPFSGITRRHDRDPAAGWGWGGAKDTGGYSSTQIMSTSLFRAYRSLGGDAPALADREFAARWLTYLILAAVESETQVTQPAGPEDFAEDVMDADLATITFDGHPGGAFHKVVRWAFERQDAYDGEPPDVDVYIDDGRAGEYQWIDDYTAAADVWVRREADGGATHQDPYVGTTAFVYVRVQNRGSKAAAGITVEAFSGPTAGNAVWPTDFTPLDTAQLPAPGPIPPGGSVVIGPFAWTPPDQSKGASILMSVSSDEDSSNVLTVASPAEVRRLVPFDNNLGQRQLQVRPLPYQYSVKFVCGCAGDDCKCGPVAPGKYFTAINIHNPSDKLVKFRKKVAVALPGEQPGHVSKFTSNALGGDEALEIDCPDIYRLAGLPKGCFLKGFLVIQSLTELDVVAVYTAAGADGHVETLDVEYIEPRIRRRPPPEKPPEKELADLIPVPAFPPAPPNSPGQLPQNYCFSTFGGSKADALRIVVRNQGGGDAGPSVTQVDFDHNPPIQVPTPPVPANSEVQVEVKIPKGCFEGDLPCNFRITVDATSVVAESDESNNTDSGFCPGLVG